MELNFLVLNNKLLKMKRLELKGKRTFFGDETMIIKKFLVQISPKSFISNTSNSWISNRNSNSLIF